MAEWSNPYAAPTADDDARDRDPREADGQAKPARKVDEETLAVLRGTRGWVSLAWVVLIVTAVLGGLAIGGAFVARMSLPDGSRAADRALGSAAPLIFPGLMSIYPALKARAYAIAIDKLLRTRARRDLTTALRHQRTLWAYSASSMLLVAALFGLTLGVMQCAPSP